MGSIAALGLVAGIVLVAVAWLKRSETWAPSVFWVGVVLLLLPIVWEFAEGFIHGMTEAPR
jgi:hypothetical protein